MYVRVYEWRPAGFMASAYRTRLPRTTYAHAVDSLSEDVVRAYGLCWKKRVFVIMVKINGDVRQINLRSICILHCVDCIIFSSPLQILAHLMLICKLLAQLAHFQRPAGRIKTYTSAEDMHLEHAL